MGGEKISIANTWHPHPVSHQGMEVRRQGTRTHTTGQLLLLLVHTTRYEALKRVNKHPRVSVGWRCRCHSSNVVYNRAKHNTRQEIWQRDRVVNPKLQVPFHWRIKNNEILSPGMLVPLPIAISSSHLCVSTTVCPCRHMSAPAINL